MKDILAPFDFPGEQTELHRLLRIVRIRENEFYIGFIIGFFGCEKFYRKGLMAHRRRLDKNVAESEKVQSPRSTSQKYVFIEEI